MQQGTLVAPSVAMETTDMVLNNSVDGPATMVPFETPPEQREAIVEGVEKDDSDEALASASTPSPQMDVLQRLKQQVASVVYEHARNNYHESARSPSTGSLDLRSHAAVLPASMMPVIGTDDRRSSTATIGCLSPPSLLSAAAAMHYRSTAAAAAAVAGSKLAYAELSGGSGESPSPPDNLSGSPAQPEDDRLSPHSASVTAASASNGQAHAPWNYEEQFKQLYEIDDNPKRREFLEDLFRFMHSRAGTPINRLPIMAKQVLDLFELFNLVVARGGLVEVINKKLWQEIIKGLKLPSSITSAAFTLRTQYMKYLYPYECHTKNLSNPADLQSAIDGNRREGRRNNYNNSPYAEFLQRSPLLPGSLHPHSFGGLAGLTSTPHHGAMPPLSLATAPRPGLPLHAQHPAVAAVSVASTAVGHPLPPSSPFLSGLGAPMLPPTNDTLLTLWNLYSKRNGGSPPLRKHSDLDTASVKAATTEGDAAAPQNEALNLGMRRLERAAEIERARRTDIGDFDRPIGSENVVGELRNAGERTYNHSMSPPAAKKCRRRSQNGDRSAPHSHTKMSISKGDNSMVISMELDGIVYQGVLFAQSETAPA